jgi:hypothetical protein
VQQYLHDSANSPVTPVVFVVSETDGAEAAFLAVSVVGSATSKVIADPSSSVLCGRRAYREKLLQAQVTQLSETPDTPLLLHAVGARLATMRQEARHLA